MEKISQYQPQPDKEKSDIAYKYITESKHDYARFISTEKERDSALPESYTSEKKLKELNEMKAHFVSIAYGGKSLSPGSTLKTTPIRAKIFLSRLSLAAMRQSLLGIVKSMLF